jgi:NADPH:quinone reductase-like Zn-dependent oxidoreductase
LQPEFLKYFGHPSKISPSGKFQAWVTATQALHLVSCFKSGDNVLWHAGASAVSMAGIRLAKAAGAGKIFITASTDSKVVLKELGATDAFNYHTDDRVLVIQDQTAERDVDVIVDFIRKDYCQRNCEAAAMDRRIVQLASLSGAKLAAGLDIGLLKNK